MRASNDNQNTDRRFCRRTKRFKKVQIILNGGGVCDAIMRNMSRTGAQLDMISANFLPSTFKMQILDDDNIHACQLVWRRHGVMGVTFVK